ncbi:hypothetical protein [Sphingobium mellinum]|uniref:hypothetical protein n=1 Tax=Sphingobium mellinum TaxID=1387166 RepID=UPI0030ED8668
MDRLDGRTVGGRRTDWAYFNNDANADAVEDAPDHQSHGEPSRAVIAMTSARPCPHAALLVEAV